MLKSVCQHVRLLRKPVQSDTRAIDAKRYLRMDVDDFASVCVCRWINAGNQSGHLERMCLCVLNSR